jgi:4-amino-4-deoxy-L-arabinose transferase-like glycosyltransferase
MPEGALGLGESVACQWPSSIPHADQRDSLMSGLGPARPFLFPGVVLAAAAGALAFALRTPVHLLQDFQLRAEFWFLEALFWSMAVTTLIEFRRLQVERRVMLGAVIIGVGATLATVSVAPRTSRIYYDEQIYQGVAQNLSDLHRAQMCNEGTLDYGRLRCAQGEFNKEPNGYPYLLSLAYRVIGVHDRIAFDFNNLVAGVTAFVVVLLGALLLRDVKAALLSGVVVAALPMQLWWTNTAAAEPSAALMTAAALLAAVHFVRVRTPSSLAWTVTVTAFATTMRPESVLAVPLVVITVLLLAPSEFRRPMLWWGAAAGAVLCLPTLLHLLATRQEAWGAPGARFGWQHVRLNLSPNTRFYFGGDDRFPVLIALAALAGVVSTLRSWRRTVLIAGYFLMFWGIFVGFYAGSYYYGADVRYALLSHVPLALLAGASLSSIAGLLSLRLTGRAAFAVVAAATLLQFSWHLPVAREVGEEAWAARADVTYARQFAQQLPANSVVLTHNPSLFHVWGISASQLSLAKVAPAYLSSQYFDRFTGGVYLHWNFWCNVNDDVQTRFCHEALAGFPSEVVASARERTYQYRLYRLTPPIAPQPHEP